MTAPRPAPRAVLWGACERCGRGGPASPADARFCRTCLPPPSVIEDRAAKVARRVSTAIASARRSRHSATDAPVAPDAEHVWLQPRDRGVAHLFADDEQTSLCGRIWLGRRARADLDAAAPENGAACRTCWSAYRSGRRRP